LEDWKRITQLLSHAATGDNAARTELFETVYQDLHRIAQRVFAGERRDHTLQPTALLNEAFLKLSTGATVDYKDRIHFFAVAAQQMRRILVDHARKRKAEKRGGGANDITLTLFADPSDSKPANMTVDLLDVNRALEELAELDPRTARVVDLRFFAGLTEEETAAALELSPATVRADWRFARGWLVDRLGASERS
jgi:RNA polymerase sigma-70 factor (ECF subfamily)